MAVFVVRTYCPYDDTVLDEEVEAVSEAEARKKALGMEVECPYGLPHTFEIEEFNLIGVYAKPYVIVEAVKPTLRYTEIVFREAAEADSFAGAIEREAILGPYLYFLPYKGRSFRSRVYKSPDPRLPAEVRYWVVRRLKRKPREARVWRVDIPHWTLCSLLDGRRAYYDIMVKESFHYKCQELMPGTILNLCAYHAGMPEVAPGTVLDKIHPVPDGLCLKYCPQCIVFYEYDEFGKRRKRGLCRAFLPALTDEERKKRLKKRYGMHALCLEDEWWFRYWA